MRTLKIIFAIGCGLFVAACGGGGSTGATGGSGTPADFSGTWNGNSSGTAFVFSIVQTGSNFNMTRTTPPLAGTAYTGTVSGTSALVTTYINNVQAATSTLTLTNDTTASMTVNTCTPPTGYSCAAPGTTIVLTRLTSTPATNASRFTKIDSFGNRLSATATNWSCTLDTKNGLLWEVKTDDGGLRDKDWVYTAYEATGTNGNGVCDVAKSCNQFYFRDAVNLAGLCGYKDWRLSRVTELEGLLDSSQPQAPFIDIQYFPFTKSGKYWTGSGYGGLDSSIWWVDFSTSNYSASTRFKDIQLHVRLVRP